MPLLLFALCILAPTAFTQTPHELNPVGSEALPPPNSGNNLLPGQTSAGNISNGLTANVVEGFEVEPFEYPFMVAMIDNSNGVQLCGASFIHERFILTAAHCTENSSPGNWHLEFPRHDLRKTAEEEGSYSIRPLRIHDHPGYNTNTLENDISLFELPFPVTDITPIALSTVKPSHGTDSFVIGWGQTNTNNNRPVYSDVLLQGDLQTAACPGSAVRDIDEETLVCAADILSDACSGDSGGPLIVERNGGLEQVGIVSFGPSPCNSTRPGAYSNVEFFHDWIESVIDSSSGEIETTPIACGDTKTGDTRNADDVFGVPNGDAIFTFEQDQAAAIEVTFNGCESNFDTWFHITEHNNLGNVICECDDCGDCGLKSSLTCLLDPGMYFFVVSGYNNKEGIFDVTVECDIATVCGAQENLKYSSTGGTKIRGVTEQECCESCADDDTCLHWTYRESRTLCWLLPTADLDPIYNNKWSSDLSPPAEFEIGRYKGRGREKHVAPTENECARLCQLRDWCERWSFRPEVNTCFLYEDNPGETTSSIWLKGEV